jgi:hypothetical protein
MDDAGRVWVASARTALLFVDEPLVRARWTEPSALPDMTVGTLVGHLLHGGILMAEEALAITEIPDREPLTAARLLSWTPLDDTSPVHDGVRSFAESQAVAGLEELLERTRDSLKRTEARLAVASPNAILAFPWDPPSLTMELSEFLLSRVLELVVHVDDLAHSVGIEALPFEREAIALVCRLGVDIDIQRYGPEAVMRSLFRRDRNSLDALRPF